MMKSMVKYGNHSHHFEGILCSCGKIIHLLLYLVNRNEDAHNPIFNLKEGWGGGGGVLFMQAIPCAQYYNLKWEGVFILLH